MSQAPSADVRHEFADPGAALTVLVKGLDRCEHDLATGIAGHRAEALSLEIALRDGLAVHLFEQRLVVVDVAVRRRAVLEKVDGAFGLGRDVREAGQAVHGAGVHGRGVEAAIVGKNGGQGGPADAQRGAAEEMTSIDQELGLVGGMGDGCHGATFSVALSER